MFKKKIQQEKIKVLSQKDITEIKNKLSEKEDLSNLKIKDLNIKDIIPQSFKGAVVNMENNRVVLYANDDFTGDKFKTFKKSAGGRFFNDILNFNRGKQTGKYLLVEGKNERKIIRLIEDDEMTMFQSLRLINGIIKDKPFMLLRNLDENEKLTNSVKYIEKNRDNAEIEEVMNMHSPFELMEETDDETNISSVSLFDE